ncbi:putative lachesin-like [Penaeus vannamei]|uniref:Putative lachesin-like n=1 Tax=Penaeus vannamei TaxID=6689 RepID=A0A3R7SHK1_PENVA|nr:putative lachesin-like [Penaeus vannamei]
MSLQPRLSRCAIFYNSPRFGAPSSGALRDETTCLIPFLAETAWYSTGNREIVSQFVNLNVIVPEAFILGNSEYHVETGSPINLYCIIEQTPIPPHVVYWKHNDRLLNYDTERGGVSVTIEHGAKTSSRLVISGATTKDEGNYTCEAPKTLPAYVYVFTLRPPACLCKALSLASSVASSSFQPLWASLAPPPPPYLTLSPTLPPFFLLPSSLSHPPFRPHSDAHNILTHAYSLTPSDTHKDTQELFRFPLPSTTTHVVLRTPHHMPRYPLLFSPALISTYPCIPQLPHITPPSLTPPHVTLPLTPPHISLLLLLPITLSLPPHISLPPTPRTYPSLPQFPQPHLPPPPKEIFTLPTAK